MARWIGRGITYVQSDPVNFVDPSGLLPSDGTCQGAECPWSSIGGGFWGGGFGPGNGWGDDPRPGLGDIDEAQQYLHPISIVIGDVKYNYRFLSVFTGYSLFFGFSGTGPAGFLQSEPKIDPVEVCVASAVASYLGR